MKNLFITYKDGKTQNIKYVEEFAFGKNYLFIHRNGIAFSINTSLIDKIKMGKKHIKIPKRCLGGKNENG